MEFLHSEKITEIVIIKWMDKEQQNWRNNQNINKINQKYEK